MADALTGRQRRHLRALGHHLQPVVQVGHEGITEAVVRETHQQLETHELIKVRIGESSPQDRHEGAELLAEKTGAQVAQVRSVAEVAARWPIAGVVVQDEFTHDVIAELPDRFLVFDSG